jgi:hypothetical protein
VQAVTLGHGTAANAMRVELPTDGTGLVLTNPGTAANWGVGATGSAVPANSSYSGMNVAGNLTGLVGKGASTTPAASDAALVVSLSPNSSGLIGTGTPGTPNTTTVVSVQGEASMTKLLVTPDANSSVNLTQVGGSSIGLGSTTASASVPVVLASNQTAADPCMFQAKTNVAISTATGTTALVTGVSAKKIYVCSFALIAPSAVSVSLAEGSSSTCGTSAQAAVIGVATNGTAANGMPLAANGGLTIGNGGGVIAATATNANYLCLFQSGTAQLAGNLTYVQQ